MLVVSAVSVDLYVVVFIGRKLGDVLIVIKKDSYPGFDVQVIVKSFQFATLVR